MNHELLQLIGALTTAAGFLITLYTGLTSSINPISIIVLLAGIGLLFLSRYIAKVDLARRRKKSKYLSSLDKKNKEENKEEQK
ncbi:MAG: hypothetical protein PHD88_06055 [Firmicutes bacterium]|nr:hypothetical protein [Bacillota bacterium]MDD4263720.1 hypothetical protein [Bacillota bacterium]MDD4693944.1 hypothetical protein [Bacillota bacterium]